MKKLLLFCCCIGLALAGKTQVPVKCDSCKTKTRKDSTGMYISNYTYYTSAVKDTTAKAGPAPIPGATPPRPLDFLACLLVGAVLGMTGQGARVLIGLKKTSQVAADHNKNTLELVELQRIRLTLGIALCIGAIAGVCSVIYKPGQPFTTSAILAIVAAGYAGTDFIEGAFRKPETPQALKN